MSLAPQDAAGRDRVVAAFRRRVYDAARLTLFPHQAEWQLASEGWTLVPQLAQPGDRYQSVLLPNPEYPDDPSKATTQLWKVVPREGGAAHVCWDLAAFKAGKSYSAGAWATGFAVVPRCYIVLLGAAYTTSEPEFGYICDFLCSSEYGLGLKPVVRHQDAEHGRMKLVFKNGAKFEAKSWDRKEDLKGKKVTAYIFTEAYQLPGLQVFTSVSQNLRQERGFAIFPTTPDRPWVTIGHELGHGANPDWHCTCGIDARVNPHTYSQADRDRDDPDKGGIMTREKFDIHWRGKLGSFIGQVYNYQRGQQSFNPISHPQLFTDETLRAYA